MNWVNKFISHSVFQLWLVITSSLILGTGLGLIVLILAGVIK